MMQVKRYRIKKLNKSKDEMQPTSYLILIRSGYVIRALRNLEILQSFLAQLNVYRLTVIKETLDFALYLDTRNCYGLDLHTFPLKLKKSEFFSIDIVST